MAMTPEEKRAYNREYYQKYRKKGAKKGRKKGKGKTASAKKQTLTGLSNSGLNDAGKMEWSMAKEKLTSEMNSALAGAKTDAEKDQIRREYQNKALAELKKIKSDPSMAQTKKSSASKGASKGLSSKGTSSKGSSGSSGGTTKDAKAKFQSTPKQTTAGGTTVASTKTATSTGLTDAQKAQRQALVDSANALIKDVTARLSNMDAAEKAEVKAKLTSTLADIKKKVGLIK